MSWHEALRTALPVDRVTFDADRVAARSADQAAFVTPGRADALVYAADEADVVATLRVADAHGVPVVTRGGGTGLTGAANAHDSGIVLDVSAMDRIVSIDPGTRTAVVEPGVITADLVAAAAARGLRYAPDPASFETSTIGGNIATNAGGACCFKYGVTGDHVAALRVVLADGSVIRTGSVTTKDVAGLDLTRLIVGSEGTLGVIVEATVRLVPAGAPPATLAATFPTTEAAGRAIVAMEAAASLSLIELMDRTTIRAVEAHTPLGLDTTAGALVVAQSDGSDPAGDVARCVPLCEAAGASSVQQASDPVAADQLLHARRLAYPAIEALGTVLLDDVAVPKPRTPELLARIDAIADRLGLVIGTFGHAGDGNFHPTIVFDADDPASSAAAERAFEDIALAAIELGGTVSGEHGVGSLKLPYLDAQVGRAELALMRRVRAAFDPNGTLNPGRGY